MASTKTKQPFDVSEALREAARKRREAALIDCQRLAGKLASTGELTDAELTRVDQLIREGLEPGEFDRAVAFLADVPSLEATAAKFDFEASQRTIATLEADLARMIADNRRAELEAAATIADLRTRHLGAETCREKLVSIKARYPHAV